MFVGWRGGSSHQLLCLAVWLLLLPHLPQPPTHPTNHCSATLLLGVCWNLVGLGWVSVGVNGSAELKVWVPEGVSVTLHDALIPDYAKVWHKPGFSAMLPKPSKKAQAKKLKGGSSRVGGSDSE